jgi:phosphatidylglycerophosphate synthase
MLVEERLQVRPSLIGKWSTMLQLLTLAIALFMLHDARLISERVLDFFIAATALATIVSGCQYLYRGLVWLQNRASSITPPG